MIFRNLDSNHDWQFGQGLSNFVGDEAAIDLNIETRILSWLNDCFFDLGAGIDWVNILGSKNMLQILSLNMQRLIMQSYGVVKLLNFNITLTAARQFKATYNIQTIFSPSYQSELAINLNNLQNAQ
jgi:hypothetical protein